MSLEIHSFLRGARPTQQNWQAAIDSLGYPVQLDLVADFSEHTGFLPCKLRGDDSGFELFPDSAAEIVSSYPSIEERVRGREVAISFRWGGDLKECACVMAAAAGLIKCCDALIYSPDDNLWYSADQLRAEFDACLSET